MDIVKYVLAFIAVTTVGMLYDRYSKKFYADDELDKFFREPSKADFLKSTTICGSLYGSTHFQSINSGKFVFTFISSSLPVNSSMNHLCFCPLYFPFQIFPIR